MRRLVISAFLVVLAVSLFGETYSQKVRLRSQIKPPCPSFGTELRYSDIHADGNIAVQGSYNCRGVFIFDVSNPAKPTVLRTEDVEGYITPHPKTVTVTEGATTTVSGAYLLAGWLRVSTDPATPSTVTVNADEGAV